MSETERGLSHEYGIGTRCRCALCRHARFNPGPPTMTKRQARNRAHDEALIEDAERARTTSTQETK